MPLKRVSPAINFETVNRVAFWKEKNSLVLKIVKLATSFILIPGVIIYDIMKTGMHSFSKNTVKPINAKSKAQNLTKKAYDIWTNHKISIIALSIVIVGLAIKFFPFSNVQPSQAISPPIQENSDNLAQMQSLGDEISSTFQDIDSKKWDAYKETHQVLRGDMLDDHTTFRANQGEFFLKENGMVIKNSTSIACLTKYEEKEAEITFLDPSLAQGKSSTKCCAISDPDIIASVSGKLFKCFYPNPNNVPWPAFDAKNSDNCFDNYCLEQSKAAGELTP